MARDQGSRNHRNVLELLLIAMAGLLMAMPMVAFYGAPESANNHDNKNQPDAHPSFQSAVVSSAGADGCLRCHDTDSRVDIAAVFQSPHGVAIDPQSPFAQDQCESCHGPGSEHSKRLRRGDVRPPMINFSKSHRFGDRDDMTELRNQQCLNCHQEGMTSWQGSQHHSMELECTQCHSIHVANDPIMQPSTQAEVCYQCHRSEKADSVKLTHHALDRGTMTCTDCHSPHDSENEHSLQHFTVNQTCYQCHADKRGPFLWEHAPVTEDCTYCHEPHGSVNSAMLNRRAPLLCQQCHNARDHASIGFSGADRAAGRAEIFLLSNSCTNCHTHVHGSNHPSGENLNR